MPFIHPEYGPLHLGRPNVSPHTPKSQTKRYALHSFLETLPDAPEESDYTFGITDWGMMLNDSLGDCTCAENGHALQLWSAASGTEITVSDSAIEAEYQGACGYVPGNPATDQGGDIDVVLDYFQNVGVGGYKIDAHAPVNITQQRIQQAHWIFGGLDLGIQLPLTAQNQVGKIMDIVGNPFDPNDPAYPNSWGGHSALEARYTPELVYIVTWELLQAMTWRFFMLYVDMVRACISPLWKPPMDVSKVSQYLQQVGT